VQVDTAAAKDGEAESNRTVVAPNTTMAGALTGTGSLIKRGDGVLELAATNTYTGQTVVEAGKLVVNGSLAVDSDVSVLGGILGGSGTIHGNVEISSGAILSPGNSPGIFSTGDLNLNAGSTYLVEIDGVTPGTGYDRTNVTGTVDLGGATLSLVISSFDAPEGGEYIIIMNDGIDEIVNRFAGLEDGALVAASFAGKPYAGRISYHAGDGNDVSIIVDKPNNNIVIPAVPSEIILRVAEESAGPCQRRRRRHLCARRNRLRNPRR
jgi:autotransporter-associated beta strand protein